MTAPHSTGNLQFERRLDLVAWMQAYENDVIDQEPMHGAGEAVDLSSGSLEKRSPSGHDTHRQQL